MFSQNLWLCGLQKNYGKFLKRGIPDHLTCLLKDLYATQEATARSAHGTTHWFKLGKGVQGCILSPCLTYMQVHHAKCQAGWITSWNQDCQEKYQPQMCRWYHSKGKVKNWKLLDEAERGEWKCWLKTTLKNLKSRYPVPSLHGKKKEKKWKQWHFIFLGSKSLWTETATMKLKDACSLEEKLWQT